MRAHKDMSTLCKEWDEALCPICMDHPHNAVLLLCSSHEKGCRSYICDTSYRHSNCLDRFKRMKVTHSDDHTQSSPSFLVNGSFDEEVYGQPSEPVDSNPRIMEALHGSSPSSLEQDNSIQQSELGTESRRGGGDADGGSHINAVDCLKCPLCRGDVTGWKAIPEARQYLDEKSRACSRESCAFAGTYRELRRHARRIHPATRPTDVDPSRRRAWNRLENQRDYGDILSAIRSAMPGAVMFGDYAMDARDGIWHDHGTVVGGPLLTTFFLLHMMSSSVGSADEPRLSSRGVRRSRSRYLWGENLLGLQDDEEDGTFDDGNRRPRSRARFGRSRSEERP